MDNEEAHELEKQTYDQMDRVDRRDKRDIIISGVPSKKFKENYDKIKWGE